MPRSRGLRWLELTLWALGILLVGVALVATSARWSYQAQQERAVFSEARPDPGAAGETPRRDPVPVPVDWVSDRPVPAPRIETAAKEEKPPSEEPVPPSKPKRTSREAEPKPKPRRVAIDPSAVGRIEIPRIGVRAIIRKGADEDTLERAVGLVPGTANPGETGNVVLAAHRDTFFRPLRHIRVADRIRVVVPPNEYVYEVDSTRVVSPEETSVLRSRGTEELTLVTCYPFGFLGPAPDRFIVSAKRVQ
ncbi:MAG TPA: class D sortase [Thermoanaerobaculia bacterium]